MATNKIFTTGVTLNNANKPGTLMVSKVRKSREYLISQNISNELNTYVSFDPFATFNDLFAPEYDANGKEIDKGKEVGTPGVRSIFNKAGAVVIGDTSTTRSNIMSKKASEFRISNNAPLMDNKETRIAIKQNSGCTIKELVEASQQGMLGRETYSYSDFMYCKYLGRISNNYMVTLRRFPYPVDDYISTLGVGSTRQNINIASKNSESIGCLITWMGTPGNDMASILKYSVAMPFQEKKAQMRDNEIDADSGGGVANQIAALFDPTYRQQYMNSSAGAAANEFMGKFFPIFRNAPARYPAADWNRWRDDAKVYGPVDTVKTTYMRSDEGLDFQQNISLTFDYELRSYAGINGRQAMLDLISNILNVTYNTGTFWGGGYRGGGAHQNNLFTNLELFKTKGGFTDFVSAFSKDSQTVSNSLKQSTKNGSFLDNLLNILNTAGGMVLAGFLNSVGRPQKQMMHSILSPAPVGFWHVTIGNPHHPIMSIGNMILKNTTIEHYGPLGLDDFPTGLRVTCELTRGKSRDIRDIEKLYMHGNDRIYTSMGPKIFDMYKNSKEYRSNEKSLCVIGDADSTVSIGDDSIKIDNINSMKHVLQKYFGHADTNSIMIAAMEQENGSNRKKKKGTAGGDSSVQGNR